MINPSFVACIPAAGSGTRLKSDVPKQYQLLGGKAILSFVLAVFDSIEECDEIIIATNDREKTRDIIHATVTMKPVTIVDGGLTRQHSVANALTAVRDPDSIVLIHDAARPCITVDEIRRVANAVKEHGAALLALPSRDTVKEAEGSTILRTLDRKNIWLAQTPQGAFCHLFRQAYEYGLVTGDAVTDDVSLLENIGVAVTLVEGCVTNLKITEPSDISLAESILTIQGRLHR